MTWDLANIFYLLGIIFIVVNTLVWLGIGLTIWLFVRKAQQYEQKIKNEIEAKKAVFENLKSTSPLLMTAAVNWVVDYLKGRFKGNRSSKSN